MTHATDVPDAQEEQDNILIQQALDPENPLDFSRDLTPGEKADDAVNFSDLSDDDLAEEEDDREGLLPTDAAHSTDIDECTDGPSPRLKDAHLPESLHIDNINGDTLDDLFGERTSPPVDGDTGVAADLGRFKVSSSMSTSFDSEAALGHGSDRRTPAFANLPHINTGIHDAYQDSRPTLRVDWEGGALSKEQQLQQELFAMSGSALGRMDAVPVIETQEDLLAALWPRFECAKVPRFMDLLPPKKARYIGKAPLRRPKPVQPTRLALEIAMDQEKSFRLATGSHKRSQEECPRPGLVLIEKELFESEREEDEEDLESDYERDPVGGVSWQDLQIICEDWDFEGPTGSSSPSLLGVAQIEQDDGFGDPLEDPYNQLDLPAAKVWAPNTTNVAC